MVFQTESLYCYRRRCCFKAVFVAVLYLCCNVRTIMKGVSDCYAGECHLNNGAEHFFDSARCNGFVSIVQNN